MMTQDTKPTNGEHEGPVLTDQDGNLQKPIHMCAYGPHRCRHFGVHDWHYFYCAAQDAPNKHTTNGYAYPWKGAGKQLRDPKPDAGCPFKTPNAKSEPTRAALCARSARLPGWGWAVMNENVFVVRGIPVDGQTQVGFAGLPAQVLQQRMSDLEGHALALRWAVTIRPETNTGQMRQPMWPLCEPPFPLTEEGELPPSRREDTESVQRLPGIALPDKAAFMETPNV